MAGDWLKIESVTVDKPEVFAIAEELGIDPDAVFGKLFRIWAWADQHTVDGNAPRVTRMLIDRISNVTGFAQAMLSCGWLVETEGGINFPNFNRHNGQTAKARALGAKRASSHRGKANANSNARSVTSALPREEKRREELLKEKQVKEKFDEPPDFSDETTDDVDWLVAEEAFMRSWNSTDGTISRSRNIVPQDLKPEFRERWRDPHWREIYPQALAKFPLQCGIKLTLVRFLQDSTVEDIIGGKYDFDKQATFGSDSGSRIRTGSTDYDKPGICAESA